jgi:rhodanese-related sulfurtransferase
MQKIVIISLLLVNLLVACQAQQTDVNTFEKGLAADSVTVLDVRTTQEFNTGHLSNALHADWLNTKEFERRISFLNKQKPIYVYCLAGGRSAAAANYLKSNGFSNVVDLKGGINAWKAASKKVEGANESVKQMELTTFNTAIANGLVLVDVGASWCPPCVQMQPIIKKIVNNYNGQFKLLNVDGGNDKLVTEQLKVEQLPVFIVYKNGVQIWRKDGVATEAELKKALAIQ